MTTIKDNQTTELQTNIPQDLTKHVVLVGYLGFNNITTLRKRIAKAREQFYTSFGFLEWAEGFFRDYIRIHKIADIRLMTSEELNELGTIDREYYIL